MISEYLQGGKLHNFFYGSVTHTVKHCFLMFRQEISGNTSCVSVWMQDFALAELHKVPVSSSFHHVKVPLGGSTTLWCIHCSPQFMSSCWGNAPYRSLMETDKLHWAQDWPLWHTASYWPPARHCTTDHHPMGPAIQPAVFFQCA